MVIVSESRLSENGLEGLKLAIKKRGRGGGGGGRKTTHDFNLTPSKMLLATICFISLVGRLCFGGF